MSISIIVAIGENNEIGKNNDLLWHIPEDLKRFKKITTGNNIIMGRNTFQSLPKGALPNRTNIVITDNEEEKFENCVMAYSITEAVSKCDDDKENFIIGGGMIYKQFIDVADTLYLTKIHKSFDADIFFPEIDYSDWELIKKEEAKTSEFEYSYLIYKKLV